MALETVLDILVRHEAIDSKTDEDIRAVTGFCERALMYGFTVETGKDISFYMGGIGVDALDASPVRRDGNDCVSVDHGFWDILDGEGNLDKGDFGAGLSYATILLLPCMERVLATSQGLRKTTGGN